MNYSITVTGDNKLLISGSIHFDNAKEAYTVSKKAINELIKVDIHLNELVEIDSSGLALILGLCRYAKKQGKQVQLFNAPSFVKELSRVFGIDTILHFE